MPIWGAVIGAGALFGGSAISASGAKSAAETQAQAGSEAIDLQREIFDIQRGDLAPYQASGQVALNELMAMMGLGGIPGDLTSFGGAGTGAGDSIYASRLTGTVGEGIFPTGARTAIGRKNADILVPTQEAVAAEVRRIEGAVDAARSQGTLTQQDMSQAFSTISGLLTEYDEFTGSFGEAGAGGRATMAEAFGDTLSRWQTELGAGTLAQAPGAEGGEFVGQRGADGTFEFKPTDPSYAFRLAEGQRAVERGAGARGDALGGRAAKELLLYGQGAASQEFGSQFNRLAALAGIGQSATSQGVQVAGQTGAAQADLLTSIGAARGSGQVASGNIWGAGLANIGNTVGQTIQLQDILNQVNQPTAPNRVTASQALSEFR